MISEACLTGVDPATAVKTMIETSNNELNQ